MSKFQVLLLSIFSVGAVSCDEQSSGGSSGDIDGDTNIDVDANPEVDADPEMDAVSVEDTIAIWPAVPQEVANLMISQYGPPDEFTASHLIWHENGVWMKTTVFRDEIQHDFPTPHTDLLEQAIAYSVPLDMYDDLAYFDGSVIVERTKGEMAARCDKEGANFLALNLAHEVATGMTSWQDARDMYGEQFLASLAGEPAPYMDGLLFPASTGVTEDPDVAIIPPPE